MSGIASKPLSAVQIDSILSALKSRFRLVLNSPTRLLPGQALLASLVPTTPEIGASELVNGIVNLAWLEKDVLFKDLAALGVPGTDQASGTGDLDGDALLRNLEANPANVIKKPFPLPTTGLAVPQTSGLASQVAGTLSLPRLTVGVQIKWVLRDSAGHALADGTDMISSGLASPSVSIVIPPLFRELRRDTLANPGGSVVCLSADVTLSIGDAKLPFSLPPIPVLQLPVLVPTVVAVFSEPNFGVTQDSSVVLLVPAHSPFASAAPLFKELQKIEYALDSLRSIAGIAGFLLGLGDVIALTEQPRLRFVAANEIPKLGEIKLRRKPWYDVFGSDQTFDDANNSLFVFGLPGTKVTFFNDTFFKTTQTSPSSTQGFYEITLSSTADLSASPDASSPLPDFFVGIRAYPTDAEIERHPEKSDRKSPPPTTPANRISRWEKDEHGDKRWDTDMSSVQFNSEWLRSVNAEINKPTLIDTLTCNSLKPLPQPKPPKQEKASRR